MKVVCFIGRLDSIGKEIVTRLTEADVTVTHLMKVDGGRVRDVEQSAQMIEQSASLDVVKAAERPSGFEQSVEIFIIIKFLKKNIKKYAMQKNWGN